MGEILYHTERFTVTKAVRYGTASLETIEEVTLSRQEACYRLERLQRLHHPNILQIKVGQILEIHSKLAIQVTYTLYREHISALIHRYRKEFSREVIEKYALEMLDLLIYLQTMKVHHRNIRPEFMYLGEHGEVKLGCFYSDLEGGKVGNYYAEAQAIGGILVYLVTLRPPVELIFMEKIADLWDEKVSPRMNWLLTYLLQPEKCQLDFTSLKRHFVNSSVLPKSLNPLDFASLEKCENCSSDSYVTLDCSHKYCRKHQPSPCALCPVCNNTEITSTMTREERVSLEQQMVWFREMQGEVPEYGEVEIREIPVTVGKQRRPLGELGQVFTYLKDIITALQLIYTSYRSTSIDGNSFFRCLGIAFFERILRSNTPQSKRLKWLQRFEKRKKHFIATAATATFFYTVIMAVKPILENWDENSLLKFQELTQNVSFDAALCVFMRVISGNFCKFHPNFSPDFPFFQSFFLEPNEKQMQISASAFKLNLSIYSPEAPVQFPSSCHVSILKFGARSCLLYSVTQDYMDGYRYDTGKYQPKRVVDEFNCAFG